MTENPLKSFKRQPSSYLKLPSLGKWYTEADVETVAGGEIPIYGLSAIDDIMLNTPDAMLNGQALENVIKNCAPTIKNVKNLVIPDLESIFVAIKQASIDKGVHDIDRKCPKCDHANTFGLELANIIDAQTFVEQNDCSFVLQTHAGDLEISVKPYVFELRQIYMQKEMEEKVLLRKIDDSNVELDQFEKARIIGESVERLSLITFELVSKSITSIKIISTGEIITDQENIVDWLTDISKDQATKVMDTVSNLNKMGINKNITMICEECNHSWNDEIDLDPTSFFTKR
jgi:hypothetical protein